jgi:hypothetical protein
LCTTEKLYNGFKTIDCTLQHQSEQRRSYQSFEIAATTVSHTVVASDQSAPKNFPLKPVHGALFRVLPANSPDASILYSLSTFHSPLPSRPRVHHTPLIEHDTFTQAKILLQQCHPPHITYRFFYKLPLHQRLQKTSSNSMLSMYLIVFIDNLHN